jgi:hypothetical protein
LIIDNARNEQYKDYICCYEDLDVKLYILRNIDAAEVKEPIAKGLSKTTADGVPKMSKNCPNTWMKRSKQKQKVKQHKEGLCIFLKGQRTARNWKQTSTGEGLHWTF